MLDETKEIIRAKYDHKDGVTELCILLSSSRNKSGKSLLSMTKFDKKIKLNQMQNTWKFTRFSSLFLKYVETLI